MAAPLLTGALLSAALAWGSVPVARVDVEAPGAADLHELQRLFGVVAGEALSRSAVRSGVQALLASGLVEDVSVTVDEAAEGAVVSARLQVASRLTSFKVTGLPSRARRAIRPLLSFSRGVPLHVVSFERAVERARDVLRADGFPDATLEPELSFDVGGGTVAVKLVGKLGAPTLARFLTAPGSGLQGDELWKACGLSVGRRLTTAGLEGARRRLAETLRRNGYWETEVESAQVAPQQGGTEVTFVVDRGPRYRLELTGIERRKALELEALPFLRGEESFHEAGLDLSVRRLRTFLERQSRYLAQVSAEVVEGDPRTLTISVQHAEVVPIVSVLFPGVDERLISLLRDRVGARAGHPGRWGGEPVDEDTLAADAASLLGTLQEDGYADARIGEARFVAYGAGAAVEFPVVAGGRTLVGDVAVSGVPSDVTVPSLPLAAGGPWSVAAEARAKALMVGALTEAGYADARVWASHECSGGVCAVRLEAEPGGPVTVGTVVFSGLGRTSRGLVARVAGIRSGDVVGPEAQLAAQRRLLELGIFQRVAIRPVPGDQVGNRRDLLVEVEEGQTRAVGVGFGWDTEEQLRVSLSLSELNLFGLAQTLSFDGRISSREKRYQINFREPTSFGVLGFPTSTSIYRTEEHWPTYDLLRRGMWIEFGARQRRPGRLVLRYEYQITVPDAPPEVLSDLEHDEQEAKIASVTPILEWDSRDDPFEPRRGSYATLQFQYAFPAFDAQASFDKLTGSVTSFAPAGGGTIAGSLRFGGIEPRNQAPGTPDNLAVPIAVRYFAGGRVSHRAFGTDELGIVGQTLTEGGDPLGGAGMAIGNLEWRFPVVGVVGGSLFVDAGNVWAAWRDIKTADVRWGAGIGVRVLTPVGPLRLEYGWKLDREAGESPGQLFLSFGNPF